MFLQHMHKWTLASILTLRASSPTQHRTISVLIFTSLGQCDFSEENQTKAMDLIYNTQQARIRRVARREQAPWSLCLSSVI